MDAEPLPWTMAQHLAAGSTAIMQIEADISHLRPQPICDHFYESDPIDPTNVSMKATFCHAVALFALIKIDFLPDRLEAWETVKPSDEWLHQRIPAILAAARSAGLVYQGWTWEPRGRQPIGACNIQVINNRTV